MGKPFVHSHPVHLKQRRLVSGVVQINKRIFLIHRYPIMIKPIGESLSSGSAPAGKDLLEQKAGCRIFQSDIKNILKSGIPERNGGKGRIFQIRSRLHHDLRMPAGHPLFHFMYFFIGLGEILHVGIFFYMKVKFLLVPLHDPGGSGKHHYLHIIRLYIKRQHHLKRSCKIYVA